MSEADQQFLAIAAGLATDRTFVWHVRGVHAAAAGRRALALGLLVLVLASLVWFGRLGLVEAEANLRTLGHR